MRTAFEDAFSVMFTDVNISKAATYSPVSGAPVSVRAILTSPSSIVYPFESPVSVEGYMVDVRKSEVAQPVEGDEITIGSDTYTVRSVKPDTERLVWRLEIDKQ